MAGKKVLASASRSLAKAQRTLKKKHSEVLKAKKLCAVKSKRLAALKADKTTAHRRTSHKRVASTKKRVGAKVKRVKKDHKKKSTRK
jgi:hypothetical protein